MIGSEPDFDWEVIATDLRADNYKLRCMLALHAGSPLMYTDDGEMSDGGKHPHIDFKRDDPDSIELKLVARAQTAMVGNQVATIDYTNWRGERGTRTIRPLRVFWGCNEFHKDPQWLLQAFDTEKAALRTFALKDIHSWS